MFIYHIAYTLTTNFFFLCLSVSIVGRTMHAALVLTAVKRYAHSIFSTIELQLRDLVNRGSSVGTEELGHLEMVGAIIYQLTKNQTPEDIKKAGLDGYFVDHTMGIYPASAEGVPFTAAYIQSKGDPITDLHENLAAEEKAV